MTSQIGCTTTVLELFIFDKTGTRNDLSGDNNRSDVKNAVSRDNLNVCGWTIQNFLFSDWHTESCLGSIFFCYHCRIPGIEYIDLYTEREFQVKLKLYNYINIYSSKEMQFYLILLIIYYNIKYKIN